MNLTEHSKFLSYVLRHRPDSIGITLDEAGWVSIETLLVQCAAHERSLNRTLLDEVVRTDSKSRYAISEDGLNIRANQGHSVEVDLGYKKAVPPVVLYHGTVEVSIKSIMNVGLKEMKRHHVHMSLSLWGLGEVVLSFFKSTPNRCSLTAMNSSKATTVFG